jgi:hypothetical protein
MENRKFLKYVPAWLRSIPNMGAFAAGWLTILAWFAWTFGAKISYFQGEGGYVLFFLVFAVLWLGFTAGDIIAKTTGWDYNSHPIAAQALAVVLTVTLNTLTVWLALILLRAAVRGLRRKPSQTYEKRQ